MTGRRLFYIILSGAALLAVCLCVFFAYSGISRQRAALEKKRAQWVALERDLLARAHNFKGTSAIVVKDLRTNWEISLNKERLVPSASLVKVPIMAAVLKDTQGGRIKLEGRIRLKAGDKVSGSGELKTMPAGRDFSVEELTALMITRSDNTATNMLIELAGPGALNSSFSEFGLRDTNLSRKMMEFAGRKNGRENYTSARDMAYILEKIYRNQLCNAFVSQKCMELLKKQKSRDRIPAQLPGGIVIAHKTGLENKVCHDAGIVFTPNGDFLICVLTKGQPNSRVSKKFISDIAFKVYNYYKQS